MSDAQILLLRALGVSPSAQIISISFLAAQIVVPHDFMIGQLDPLLLDQLPIPCDPAIFPHIEESPVDLGWQHLVIMGRKIDVYCGFHEQANVLVLYNAKEVLSQIDPYVLWPSEE